MTKKMDKGDDLLKWNAWAYGLYAFFVLTEIFYFLSLLHYRENEGTLIFSMVHVGYFMIEMIICIVLTFVYVLLMKNPDRFKSGYITLLAATIFRCFIVYYFYIYSDEEGAATLYIYKIANAMSETMRTIFPYTQIILGILASVYFIRHRKMKVQ
ncbi:MAG: hypothetical protein AAFZ89_06295 [Bacteroidota bacterium]